MNSRTKSYKLDFSEQAWIYFFYCTEIFPNKLTERGHRVVALATPTQAFSCKFCKILKNIFFTEQLRDTKSLFQTNEVQQGNDLSQLRENMTQILACNLLNFDPLKLIS